MRPVLMLITGLSVVSVAAASVQAAPVRPSVAGFAPTAGAKIGSTARAGAMLSRRSKLGGDGLVGVVIAGGVGGGIGYAAYKLIQNHHGSTHDAFSVSP